MVGDTVFFHRHPPFLERQNVAKSIKFWKAKKLLEGEYLWVTLEH